MANVFQSFGARSIGRRASSFHRKLGYATVALRNRSSRDPRVVYNSARIPTAIAFHERLSASVALGARYAAKPKISGHARRSAGFTVFGQEGSQHHVIAIQKIFRKATLVEFHLCHAKPMGATVAARLMNCGTTPR